MNIIYINTYQVSIKIRKFTELQNKIDSFSCLSAKQCLLRIIMKHKTVEILKLKFKMAFIYARNM